MMSDSVDVGVGGHSLLSSPDVDVDADAESDEAGTYEVLETSEADPEPRSDSDSVVILASESSSMRSGTFFRAYACHPCISHTVSNSTQKETLTFFLSFASAFSSSKYLSSSNARIPLTTNPIETENPARVGVTTSSRVRTICCLSARFSALAAIRRSRRVARLRDLEAEMRRDW